MGAIALTANTTIKKEKVLLSIILSPVHFLHYCFGFVAGVPVGVAAASP